MDPTLDSIALGGTVTQTINGSTTIDSIDYTYDTDNRGGVTSFVVTFGDVITGRAVHALLNTTGENVLCVSASTTSVRCTPTPLGAGAPLILDSVAVTLAAGA